jgi:hypothetical protein
MAKLVLWSILSYRNGSIAKLTSFFLARENLRGLRELFLQKNPA